MMKLSSFRRFGSIPKVIIITFILSFLPEKVKAEQEEVLLSFRFPAVGNVYVNTLYDEKTNQVYIPILELFSLLEINYQPEKSNYTVRGNFISVDKPYIINLSSMLVQLGKNTFQLTSDDFRIGEMDYYLTPKVFEDIFGLNFTVDMDQLMFSLETTQTLPIQDRKARELARSRMEGSEMNKVDFPMAYDRKRSLLNGSMLDYSINGDYAAEIQSLGYTFTGGMEVLGGDIQGTVNGSKSSDGYNSMVANDLRWRYAIRDNSLITGIMAGQTSTTGLQPMSIKGIALTNDPIEPRQMYETYMIDGTTEPESEVEIYVNERLSDFKRADELGYYRFNVPISYGTTRISLRIFTPSGQLIVSNKEMQVPFTFLPRGVVSYNFQTGQIESFLSDSLANKWVTHGNIAIGLTRWLTASVGSEYIGNTFNPNDLLYYGSLSARIAKQYLLNIDAAPNNYYRLTGSVMYASNLSLNFVYTKFDGESIFNSRSATDNLSANAYFPFTILGINTGLRLTGEEFILPNSTQATYRTDLSVHLGKIDLRFNYRDNFISSANSTLFGQGLFNSAITYTIARSPGIPVYVRGMYVRAQSQYNVRNKYLLLSQLDISRTIFKTGRLNMGVAYNHLTNQLNTQIGLTLDLNRIRSVTSAYTSGNRFTARQSLTGSIGWDMPNDKLNANNRQQVGRCAASIIMFIDNNNSGHYDKGDQLLPYRGVKLDRTSTMEVGKDSILRLTQLQSYYKYNLSVNRTAIPDPTLVPLKSQFSFITDPNQYKQIEIPFYRGSIIEGSVLVKQETGSIGQGGLRLLLKAVEGEFNTVIRTMSGGDFYAMDLAPGKYTLEVDPIQLGFLNVTSQPEKLSFEIKALAEGDYLEGLTIELVPNKESIKKTSIPDFKPEQEIKALPMKDSLSELNNNSVNESEQAIVEINTMAKPDSVLNFNLKFKINSLEISRGYVSSLKYLTRFLKQNDCIKLEIQGHTDSTGTMEYNQLLSEKRAKNVMDCLINYGVASTQLQMKGYGETRPLNNNLNPEERIKNSRVSFGLIQSDCKTLSDSLLEIDIFNKAVRDASIPFKVNKNGKYYIQFGAFEYLKNAKLQKLNLESVLKEKIILIEENALFKVRTDFLKSKEKVYLI